MIVNSKFKNNDYQICF